MGVDQHNPYLAMHGDRSSSTCSLEFVGGWGRLEKPHLRACLAERVLLGELRGLSK